MKNFVSEFKFAAQRGARIYFAPLVGAYRAIRVELRRSKPSGAKQRDDRNHKVIA